MLSVVDLQVPVLGAESDFGRLEAQLLCMQTHLAHLRDQEVRLCLPFFRTLRRLEEGLVCMSMVRLKAFINARRDCRVPLKHYTAKSKML